MKKTIKPDTDAMKICSRRAWLPAIVLVCLLAVAFSAYPASDPDLFIMLAAGKLFFETGQTPKVDAWSHTVPGRPWVHHEWLSSLALYGIYSLGGITLVIIAKSLMVSAAFAAAMLNAKARGSGAAAAVAFSFLGLLAANHGFGERIQIFSFFALSLLMLAVARHRQGMMSLKTLFALVLPLFALWANMHIGFMVGLGYMGALAASELLSGFVKRMPPRVPALTMLFFCAVLATGLTPYGYGILVKLVAVLISPQEWEFNLLVTRAIYEYQPLLSSRLSMEPMIGIGLAWIFLVAAGLIHNYKKIWMSDLLAAAAWGYFTFSSIRYLWFFVFLTLPSAITNWHQILARVWEKASVRFPRLRAAGRWAPAVAIAFALAGSALYQRSGKHLWQRAGLGWKPRMYSDAGADFLKQHLDGGKVYNDFDIGGYLLWKEIPVFIDGRIAPYMGTEVLDDFFRIYGGRLELLDRYGVDWIFLPYGRSGQVDAFNRLNGLIRASGRWALVYWDDASLIYVRRAEKYSSVIRQYEYRYVNPAVFDFSPPPREYLNELERKLAEEPGALMPRIMAGNYFFYNGDAAMAEREFRQVLESDPDNAVVHNNLGNAYLRQGRLKEAMASYKKAVQYDVNLGLAYCNWGYALEALGDVKQAVKLYNIATKVTPGDPWPHNRLGVIEMKRGNRDKALEHWEKGAAIDPSSEAAQNLRRETEVR
jgi:hypothetical protein